uniref:NADH:ubiquinone oxidoreductase complex assembly factor n=1 Tax=Takifugu rubripes TaxID=31033 RepID=A0A674P843_TAKRU
MSPVNMASAVCRRFLLQRSTHGFLLSSRAKPIFFSPSFTRGHRLGPSDDEMYQRTTVTIMQKEQDNRILIQSYSPQGFNIDGNRVFGPCALLPPAILQWKVGTYKDITEESLSLFHMLEPKIGNKNKELPHFGSFCDAHWFLFFRAEILVLGTGAKVERINPTVLAMLKKKGIAVEIQDTVNATWCFPVVECPPSSSRTTRCERQEHFLHSCAELIHLSPHLCSQMHVQPSTS